MLVLSGLLALPALLVTVVMIPIQIVLSLPACYLLLTRKPKSVPSVSSSTNSSTTTATSSTNDSVRDFEERQVIVVGGSSGIGLAIAMAAAKEMVAAAATTTTTGGNHHTTTTKITRIVIVARNVQRLHDAAEQIRQAHFQEETNTTSKSNNFSIETVSVDVTDPIAIENSAKDIMCPVNNKKSSSKNMYTNLFLCVGEAFPDYYRNITSTQYEQQVRVNQLGTIYTTSAFLKHIQKGTITFTSSMAGQAAVFGFTSYSPTKFAIRAYVEALHMELYHNPDINVQIAFPPDTDTPGLARENIRKPYETQLISEVAGLSSPQQIGTTMLKEALRKNPRYQVYFNFDGCLLCALTSGFTPVTTLFDAVLHVSVLNLSRWIALFYLADWHRILLSSAARKRPATTPTVAAESSSSKQPPLDGKGIPATTYGSTTTSAVTETTDVLKQD
jgi:3-dehydrosphinganine reductase